MKLVVYFSATGKTKKQAEALAEELNAELVEITPEVRYTKADLNWLNKKSRSSVEMSNKESRPAITNEKMDMNKYEEIYLGFPIWWYVAPTIVNTFLEMNDFTDRTIKLFATSGNSGFGHTASELEVSAPNAHFEEWMINKKRLKER